MPLSWDVVCFGSVDWDSHRQRPHWVMSCLAERGARILYVDNLGLRIPRLWDRQRVVRRLARWAPRALPAQPAPSGIERHGTLVLPWQHVGAVRALARAKLVKSLRRRIGTRRPLVVWTYLPLPVIADTAASIGADVLVFDWVDDCARRLLVGSPAHRRRLEDWQEEMAKRADVVFVASPELLRHYDCPNPRTYILTHGVDEPGPSSLPPPAEVAGLARPRIGYVGSISRWTDVALLEALARARPSWSFVLVGPVRVPVDGLAQCPNVLLAGERAHGEVAAFLDSFDAALIPYKQSQGTSRASPVKLREYLAHGLPVVSIDIPDVRGFEPAVTIAEGPEEFVGALEAALRDGRNRKPEGMRSWPEQVDVMVERLSEFLS